MKVLAEQYDGKVQFAVVNSHRQEDMRATFGVRSLPAEFYYEDGIFYEQNFMQILVNNIRTFIEGRHKLEEKRYQLFEKPYLIPGFAMPFKRHYNGFWTKWQDSYKNTVARFLRNTQVTEEQSLYQLTNENVVDLDGFFKSDTRT